MPVRTDRQKAFYKTEGLQAKDEKFRDLLDQ